jgi:hypothetical protein
MENLVVHRMVEQHAATRGEVTALAEGDVRITYRELNVRANGVARRLLDGGFRRGGHAVVSADHGIDLAIILVAVLKAGGAYTWQAPEEPKLPRWAVCAADIGRDRAPYQPVDLESLLQNHLRTSPNLPVLTRPSDVACVLSAGNGRDVLVPHSTITALRRERRATPVPWEGDPSTFDLWTGLMSGATVSVAAAPALLNAA